MASVLHWIGVGIGFLVVIAAMYFFLRGLSGKPGDPPPRVPAKGRHRKA
ncbi:MAG TPA: hypothetical protein VIY51_06630 [Xanthobacteraceae bacterium]